MVDEKFRKRTFTSNLFTSIVRGRRGGRGKGGADEGRGGADEGGRGVGMIKWMEHYNKMEVLDSRKTKG